MITKYDWFKAVYAERRFSAGERSVLGYIAIVYIRDGTAFCVRQSVIAQRCDVSEMLAGRAIRKAKRLGYLVLSRPRERGTGRDRADELTLTLPTSVAEKLTTDLLGHSEKLTTDLLGQSESDLTKSAELPNKFDESDLTKNAELPNTANAVTSENDDPRGVSRGVSTRGVSRGARARDETEPTPAGELFSDIFNRTEPQSVEPKPVQHPLLAAVPDIIEAEVVPDTELAPYGRCDVCGTGVDDNGECPRCALRTGTWKRRDEGLA